MDGLLHLAFYNIGCLQAQVAGKQSKKWLDKLSVDVGRLWKPYALHALFLCEAGEHGIGLSFESRDLVVQAIRAILPSINIRIVVQNAYIAVLNTSVLAVLEGPTLVQLD